MPDRNQTAQRGLAAALYRIFQAIARISLRQGLPYDAVAEIAKRAFIDVAQREFTLPRRKQSASRVSVLTGIHRKEIARVLSEEDPEDRLTAKQITASAGVVSGWRRDAAFTDRRGNPLALHFDEGSPSFADVVRRYGKGDIPARAVLDELVRVGAVTRLRDGRLRLTAVAYVPETTSAEALAILGSDVSDLIGAIDHNLAKGAPAYFQRKVSYDDVPSESLDAIRERVDRDGQAALEKLDRAISRHDRDTNPKVAGTGRKRVMVGIYYYEDDVPEE